MNRSHTIAVIGAGASGTLVAAQLLRQAQAALHIVLIEPRSLVGRGVAYSTTNRQHLLNVPVGKMSAYPDRPEHFSRWLLQHHEELSEVGAIDATSFVPRMVYGIYLQDVLLEAEGANALHVLERIHGEVIALHPTASGAELTLRGGRCLHADQVVLATGNPSPRHPSVETPEFYMSPRYRGNPWCVEAIASIDPTASVFLLGSGLTMVDVAVALRAQGHTGSVLAVSRRGLFPHAHTMRAHSPTQYRELPATVGGLLRAVRTEARASREDNWRGVVDGLRPHVQALWQAWSVAEKQQFLRHVQPYWDVRRHRIAPAVALAIEQMRGVGQLEVCAGRVQRYDETDEAVRVTIRLRRTHQSIVYAAQQVINCTGPASDISRSESVLLIALLAQGLIQPDALHLGIDVTTDGAVIQRTGKVSPCLYTLGPLRKGTLWETTAVPEIRVQAEQLAQHLLLKRAEKACIIP